MNCINTKSKEFQELLEASKLPSLLLEMKISQFQDKNGIESYPTLEDIIKPNEVNKTLDTINWSGVTSESEETIFPDTISEETVTETKPNNNIKNLFGESESKTLTASEVLTNLLNSDVFENSKDVGFFLQQTMNLLGKSGAKFKLITEKSNKQVYDKFDDKSVMLYDSTDNTIYVTNTSLNNFDEVTIASSFIHEVTHSTTVQAYFNPKTFEEKQFKEFIDKSFNQYKYLATKRDENGKLMYGFTNQAEFIAEIYSNPKFREHLQTLEKSWWSQFVDTVRRLFGMSKNIFNTELINSAILFEVVDEFATRNKSNWKGTLINDPRYDKFGTDFFNKVEKPENSTLQDKINNLVNSQLNNIEVILRRANSMHKKFGTKNQNFINQINELNRVVNESVKTNKLKAINHYTDFMVTQIDHIFTTIKNGSNASKLDQLETIERYKSYLGASDMLKPIMDTLNDTRTKDLTEEELLIVNTIQDKLTAISGAHEQIKSKFRTHTVEALRQELKGSYFSEKVVQDFREEIGKDYPKDSSLSKKEWVNQQILERQDELTERIEKDVNEVLDGMSTDIDGFDKSLLSALNTKSRLIQILAKIIAKMKSKIDSLIRDNDFVLNDLYQNLIKEKGKYDITNLYEQSEDGTTYVKGEYSVKFRDLYINEYSKYLDEVNQLKEKHRAAGFNDFEINQFKDVNDIYRKITEWRNKHTVKVGNTLLPNPMYKNKNNFSPAEKAIYNKYKELARKSETKFGKNNSLIKTSLVDYYTLPYATVSSLERVTSGRMNVKDTVKQKVTDFTNWKIDDLENNSEEMYRQDGTRIFNIPIMYRNNVSKTKDPKRYAELIKEQSYDLLTLLRLEHYNQTNFDVKSENEMVLNSFVDIAKNKKYLKTKPGTNNLVSNLFGVKTKYVEFEGVESNEYQRIQSIVEQTLYNKFYEEGFKVFGKDVNKLVQSANKHTSFLGMTLNYFNAPVNVLNAEFQTFMIKLGGDINKGMIREAHLFYAKDLPNIIADAGRPNKMSFVNQFNLINDIFGGLTHEQNDFVKNTMLKGVTDPQMLQILQNGGEHMVQSVLNIALSKSIKVMNDKGQYINKDGNVVSEKEAASLFDMVEQNPTTKQINYNTKFTFTDKSSATKWNEGGAENVRLFIKKKIEDTMGQYDKNFQTEVQRHWWGQLFIMYKKFIIPLGIARYRGAGSALKKKTDLTEEERHWNESLQQYEEGYYITTFRFMARGMVQNLVKLKFDLISQDYNNLSDYEKANLKKGIVEIGILIMLQMVVVPLLVGMAAGDDDEDLIFLAMLARRLEQELSFYTDPNDAYKVTKNPVAALNTIESFLDVAKFTISPGLWFSENKAGTPRAYKVLEKVSIPSALRPDRTAKSVLQGMNQGLLAPYEEGIFYRLMNE